MISRLYLNAFLLLLYVSFIKGSQIAISCDEKDTTKETAQDKKTFFKYGQRVGDRELQNADDHEKKIIVPLNFRFFETDFKVLFLSINGVFQLSTDEKDKFKLYPYPTKFPIRNQAVIAPFWADINTKFDGQIFYRETTDSAFLTRLSCDVAQFFTTFINYKPSWAFIATWDEVGAHGYSDGPHDNLNTFQTVLSTDGTYSFLIFNYGEMKWPNKNVNKSVQVGFNDGLKWFYLFDGSFTKNITKYVQEESNVNIPGKWIFRIDEEEKVPKSFLKFGMWTGDHLLEKSDDGNSGLIVLGHDEIPFLNIKMHSIYIYTNGFITINAPLTNAPYQLPDTDHNLSPEHFGENNLLAPLWTDISTINGGDIFYRHVLDSESLMQINNEINSMHSEWVEFGWAFVVTWYKVIPHGWKDTNSRNTFQLVIAANDDYSFIIFNYDDLSWPNSQIDRPIQIGYYLDALQKFETLNSSLLNAKALSRETNCGVQGKFIFRINHSDYVTTTVIPETTTSSSSLVPLSSIASSRHDDSKQNEDKILYWFHTMVFFLLLIGLISVINTGLMIFKIYHKRKRNELFFQTRFSNQDDSQLALNHQSEF